MFNMTRTSAWLLAICVLSVAIVTATSALAKDEQNQNNQQNQEQQQAQTNQQTSEQPGSTTVEQQTSDQLDQQNAQQDNKVRQGEQSNQQDGSRRHDRESGEGTSGNQSYQLWHSGESNRNSQSDQQQSRGQQGGASLGVNIIGGENGQGVSITRVHSDTPAQRMGLRSRDRITSVNGAPVRSSDEFISTIRGMNPGDGIELTIVRDNAEQTIAGELEPYGQAIARNPEASGNEEIRNYQGIISRGRADSNQWSRNAKGNYSGEFNRDRSPSGQFRSDVDQLDRDAQRSANLQTSYEDHGPSNGRQSGDVDARLSRVEEQLNQIRQDIAALRNTVGTVHPSNGLPEAASEYRSNNQQMRPRAEQSGARLQRQERERIDNSKQTPVQPSGEQPPRDDLQNK